MKEQCQRERGGGSRRRPAVHFENRRRRVGGLDRSNATCPAGVRPRKAGPNQYDPFGRVVSTTGSPGIFTFRFSTKPLDKETGFYYYGYRYYDPLTGRWPSRDPIEEQGGVNLYGFVGNDGVGKWDYIGFMYYPPEYANAAGERCCKIWRATKSLRALNLGKSVISLQIDQMEGNIYELKMQIALSQFFQASWAACEKAKAKVEEETGESCSGCCITKIGMTMSRKAGRGWFGSPYKPSGRIVTIDWVNGWFAPKPCKKTVSGSDYDASIYDSTWIIESEEKKDM